LAPQPVSRLEPRLQAGIDRVVIRLGALIVVVAGLILAAIRYLPHGSRSECRFAVFGEAAAIGR
jgi:hypothetical protein